MIDEYRVQQYDTCQGNDDEYPDHSVIPNLGNVKHYRHVSMKIGSLR